MTNATIPSEWVLDQSPRSSHRRHDRPNAAQAMAAAVPGPEMRNQSIRPSPRDLDWPASAAIPSDCEYVDIDAFREFGRVRARLEHRHGLQIVRIGLEFSLEHLTDGMVMMGVIAHHALEIRQRCCLRRIRLE